MVRAVNFITPATWWSSFARKPATPFILKWPPTPEVHPQARTPDADLHAFAAKARAGADSAITQYFFNADAYFRFADECARLGLALPIVPGIMPIMGSTQLMRFSDACGAEIPRWIRLRLQGFGDDTASIKAFGLDVVTELCARLLERGAPALHFYTMNQSAATLEIAQRLGLRQPVAAKTGVLQSELQQ